MESVDLRAFFDRLGGFGGAGGFELDIDERPEPENPAELIDTHPLDITGVEAEPFSVYVDGIQHALCATRVEGRPIHLLYAAAGGAVPSLGEMIGRRESLTISCAEPEAPMFDDLGIPMVVHTEDNPPWLERRAGDLLAGLRETAEREATEEVLAYDPTRLVAVDGTLVGRTDNPRLVGVVKTTRRRYLADESVIYRLPEGWRSPRFILDSDGADRFSCYLRLFNPGRRRWDFGLIRIETRDPDLLDEACAAAWGGRSVPGSDPRWDRHLAGMVLCEQMLKASRPIVFELPDA